MMSRSERTTETQCRFTSPVR